MAAQSALLAANLGDFHLRAATLELMRFVLALLAVIGLLASPAAAAAAQATCHNHGGEIMHMAMADMPGMAMADGHKADPCCDPGKAEGQKKHSAADCAQACAVMCGVLAALPSQPPAHLAPPDHDAPPVGRLAPLQPHEPSQLERPPKSIA